MHQDKPNILVAAMLACVVFLGTASAGISLARDWALTKDAHSTGMDWASHIEVRIADVKGLNTIEGELLPDNLPNADEFQAMVADILAVGSAFQIDFINAHCHCELSLGSFGTRPNGDQDWHEYSHEHNYVEAPDSGALRHLFSRSGEHAPKNLSPNVQEQFPVNHTLVSSAIDQQSHDIFIRSGSGITEPLTFAEVYHPVSVNGEPAYLIRVLVNLEEEAIQYTQLLIWGAFSLLILLGLLAGFPVWKYLNISRTKEQADDRARYLAHHDVLTGAANRNAFQDMVPGVLEACAVNDCSACLLLVDVDKFKDINDFNGHHIGDLILKALAEHLQSCAPEGSIVARIGGDEFAVLMSGPASPELLANPLFNGKDPLEIIIQDNGRQIAASYCIGIARAPRDGMELSILMQRADLALYAAKASAVNRIREFEPEMGEAFTTRVTMMAELKDALNESQIVPFYQPIMNLGTGQVEGFEALARWEHPERGILSPAAFRDALNDRRLGEWIGREMLRQIMQDMGRWKVDGVSFNRIGINIGEADLLRPGLVLDVASGLVNHNLSPGDLAIEVTETCIFGKNKELFLAKLQELRALGCRVAIDDFGIGHSSLNHIKELPCTGVKIDKSFVRDIVQNQSDQAIIQVLQKLGQALDYVLVVEGIESKEQMELVKSFGCEMAQGFFYSPAVPAEDVPCLIKDLSSVHGQSTDAALRIAS